MNTTSQKEDPALARRVVREGLDALTGRGDVVNKCFGKLFVLSPQEANEFDGFANQITAYLKLDQPERPLCLGVFGPPGSGKSFAVKQVLKNHPPTSQLAFCPLNLSQLQGPGELSSALAEIARWSATTSPVVFFDEFDSNLAGAPLGWLQSLLAPMQDGVVVDHRHTIELKRAVFVFAGGTANTFEEFPDAHAKYFRSTKGPDFVSRLRGHLNLRGVNDWPYRRVRRAIIFRLAVERVARDLLDANECITEDVMADSFIDEILAVGRFRHAARSVEALMEMSTKRTGKTFSRVDLPAPQVRANHVDLGPLGDQVLALSAGGTQQAGATGDYDKKLEEVWPEVATRLLELGAGLVYGGDLRSGGFTQRVIGAMLALPNPLGVTEDASNDPLVRPRFGRVTWVRVGQASGNVPASLTSRVDIPSLADVLESDFEELGLSPGIASGALNLSVPVAKETTLTPEEVARRRQSLVLFRMRALVTRMADALLVFGGKMFGSSGRFPGIAEEVMLGLAAGRPVFVCGGFGGAARAVGEVLGLGGPWATVPACLQGATHGSDVEFLGKLAQDLGVQFQMPHRGDLPLTYAGLVEFLRAHAIEGSGWPDNGLTPEENRRLFRSVQADEILRLITTGLSRRSRFANLPEVGHNRAGTELAVNKILNEFERRVSIKEGRPREG